MTPSLAGFQDAFIDALYGAEPEHMLTLIAQPGFTVYRNTVLKGTTDALLANFPTIERLVGTEWLKGAADIYARATPPTDARLLYYGTSFPAFLDSFEHAQEMPYLGDVARLDLLWTEVHCALDVPALDMGALALLSPEELPGLMLKPAASCHWAWLPDGPAYTIWRINREQLEMPDELDWQGEGALLTRKNGRVYWQAASAADCAFLDACAAGMPLGDAAEKALAIEPTLNLEHLIISLVNAGAFVAASQGVQ